MKVGIFQIATQYSVSNRLRTTVAKCIKKLGGEPVDLGIAIQVDECPRLKNTQLDGDWILDRLNRARLAAADIMLGITSADVGVIGRTFVFGYAHLSDRCAIVSDARMFSFDNAVYRGRVLRVLAHELIHTIGVGHCTSKGTGCIMRSVATIEDVEALKGLCRECRNEVNGRKKVMGW